MAKIQDRAKIWEYLIEKGPMTVASIQDGLEWRLGSYQQISQMLSRCYLFEKVGTEKVALFSGRWQPVIVWGAIPLDIAARQFLDPRKHQIRPLTKQPAFVREYVEDK